MKKKHKDLCCQARSNEPELVKGQITIDKQDEIGHQILLDALLGHLVQQPVYDANLQHSKE